MRTAANEVREALVDARRASDALAVAPKGRSRACSRHVCSAISRTYSRTRATTSAPRVRPRPLVDAARVGDPAEIAWATYTAGFVDWFSGKLDAAVDEFTRAELGLRQYGSSVWRHTLLCLARAKLERGELSEGERLARQSATGATEDHGHIALLRGEAEVAELILNRVPKGFPEDEQFRDFVRALVRAQRGDPSPRSACSTRGGANSKRLLDHWSICAAVQPGVGGGLLARRVGGLTTCGHLVRDLPRREGFRLHLPEGPGWANGNATGSTALARTIRARAEAALRRAKTDAGAAVGASALDEATFGLRSMGLTWREIGILREMEQLSREGKRLDRAALAARLTVSPNTLRVHLTRIRAKLDVADKRGESDAPGRALAAAL